MSRRLSAPAGRRAGDVDAEVGERARLGAARLRVEAGREGALRHRFRTGPPPGAVVRVKPLSATPASGVPDQASSRSVVAFGPQVGGLVSVALSPPSKWTWTEVNGSCGASANGRRQLAGCRIGADVPDQAYREPVAGRLGVDEDPVLVAGGRVAAQLLAEIDVAGQRVGRQHGRLDRDGADLRGGGAGDGFVVPLPNWASVQACRPGAADGLRPRPRGRVTSRVRTFELAIAAAGSKGTRRRRSVRRASRFSPCRGRPAVGANGTLSQPVGMIPLAAAPPLPARRRELGRFFLVGVGVEEGRVDVLEGTGRGSKQVLGFVRKRRPRYRGR